MMPLPGSRVHANMIARTDNHDTRLGQNNHLSEVCSGVGKVFVCISGTGISFNRFDKSLRSNKMKDHTIVSIALTLPIT